MRKARFLVVEALYEADTSNHDPEAVYERQLHDAASEDPRMREPRAGDLGRNAIRGVIELRDELDEQIASAASQFPLDTMAVVDRNILRLAIWELVTDNSAPVAAVVNEAVELAHRYGGDSSPAFVNGVLRTVSERIKAARGTSAQDREPRHPNHSPEEN